MKRVAAITAGVFFALIVPGLLCAGIVDQPKSAALTRFLHTHRLPMVGAQVSTTDAGSRQVLLYGYVATDFGKRDAEEKSRNYLHDPGTAILNRIVVNSEVRRLKRPPQANAQADQPPEDVPEARPTAEWERTVDKMLKDSGEVPSNDPELIPYR